MYDETDMDIGEPLKQKQSQKYFFTSVKSVSIKRPRHVPSFNSTSTALDVSQTYPSGRDTNQNIAEQYIAAIY